MTTVTRYPTVHTSLQVERATDGDFSEALWTNLQNIEAYDQVFASCPIVSSASLLSKASRIVCSNFGFNLKVNARINSISVGYGAHVRNTSNGTTNVPVIPGIDIKMSGSPWENTFSENVETLIKTPKLTGKLGTSKSNCVCASMFPTHERDLPWVASYHCWLDKCPFCGGNLLNNPKGADGGEWTCAKCRADFDGVTGAEKEDPPRKYLSPCPGNGTTTTAKDKTTAAPVVQVLDPKDVQVNSIEQQKIMFDPGLVDLDPVGFNNSDFTLEWNPNRNTSTFAGTLFLDNLGVTLDYTDPTYSLAASISNNVTLGNNLTYTLTIKNTNKAHNGHGIPITFTIPSGVSFISSDNGYNNITHQWVAYLDSTGKATINITFQSVGTGNQTIQASVDSFPYTINKTSNIIGPVYTLNSTLKNNSMVVEGQNISYNISLTTNANSISTLNVNIPLPTGFNYISSSGNGTYNPTTQLWTVNSGGNNVSLTLTLLATTPGSYSQSISIGSTSITRNITVQPTNLTTCNYVEIPLPEDVIPYLNDGQTYFVSCNMEIVTSNVGSIHQGISDFCISTVTTSDDPEDITFDPNAFDNGAFQVGNNPSLVETLGTGPDTFNIYERVYAIFNYDSTQTTMIRLYGAYNEESPSSYAVRFNKWSISNIDSNYNDGGSLSDDPNLLIADGDFANIELDPGESSEVIYLTNFNLSGRESDPDLLVKGLGVSFDYNSDLPVICNCTITSNGESTTKSAIFDPTLSTLLIGSESDNWDLNNMDLTDITIAFSISNPNSPSTILQCNNIQFVLYSQEDQTGGNYGFTLNGIHSRNYNICMDDSTTKNEGIVPTITTYDVNQSQGELVTEFDLKAKTFKLKFDIPGDSLEDAQNNLTEATKYLTNDLNNIGLPIPMQMVFDWDPERTFNVVINAELTVTLDTFTYTVECDFIIPEGIGFNQLKSTGAIDTNEGLISIRPVINVLTLGGNVQIYDNISGQYLTINNDLDPGLNLVIDCEQRTIIGSNGWDYSNDVTLDSLWMVIMNDYDYSNSTGCLIQSVEYQEGC